MRTINCGLTLGYLLLWGGGSPVGAVAYDATDSNWNSVSPDIKLACQHVKDKIIPDTDRGANLQDVNLAGDLLAKYANGRGAKRDLDLAIHLACLIGGSPSEIEGRITHLLKMGNEPSVSSDFDICDDVTSGSMQGFCAQRKDKRVARGQKAGFQSLVAKWPREVRDAFEPLNTAAQRYFKIHSENEVDLSGTARGALVADEMAERQQAFWYSLQSFEQGQLPHATPAEFSQADQELNSIYRKIQEGQKRAIQGTVTREQIKKTQQAWLGYRDAWVEFGKKRYPSVSAAEWKTWATRERLNVLTRFLSKE